MKQLVPSASDVSLDVATRQWHLVRRIAFRFFCAYFVLYNLPFPIGWIPETDTWNEKYNKIWYAFVPWVAEHVLHLKNKITVFPNGSGDTTFNYVQILCFAVIASFVTLVWSIADRKRANYSWLHKWLHVYVRYVLALTMLSYGMSKVIKLQFPGPSLDRLLQPFGESSPMGLLWTFMGFSTGYTFFAGAMEVLGGVLMFFRRLGTLGAIVTIAVMTNVVLVNFCYDTPVKLYSLNLLAMAVFVAAPDLGRIASVLVLNRATQPASNAPLFARRWMNWAGIAIKTLFIGFVLFMEVQGSLESRQKHGDAAPFPPLYGIWEVEEFKIGDQVRPPLLTDADRWRRVVFNQFGSVSVRLMTDTPLYFMAEVATDAKTVTLSKGRDIATPQILKYSQPDADHLELSGKFNDKEMSAKFKRVDEKKFLLVRRGFHWINEYPFNR